MTTSETRGLYTRRGSSESPLKGVPAGAQRFYWHQERLGRSQVLVWGAGLEARGQTWSSAPTDLCQAGQSSSSLIARPWPFLIRFRNVNLSFLVYCFPLSLISVYQLQLLIRREAPAGLGGKRNTGYRKTSAHPVWPTWGLRALAFGFLIRPKPNCALYQERATAAFHQRQ